MSLKEPTANDLIPQLLEKFTYYTDKFKDRIKVDSIFSEFNDTARIELNKFIKMSQTRYKGVKSGNNLENMLLYQKPKFNKLTNNILSDIFYNTNEIEAENKKLLKKPNKKNNQELIDIRNQIILKTKDFSKNELRNRERLSKIIERKKLNQYELLSRLDFIYEPKSLKRNSPKKIQEVEKEESEKDSKDYFQPLEEQKNFFENLMNEDNKQFNDNLKEYKEYLNNLKLNYKDGDSLKKNKNEKKEEEQKFQFLTENVKLLSFKEEENLDLIPKKKEEPKFDVRKLMKYTKRGRRSAKLYSQGHFYNKLNKKNENNKKRPKSNQKTISSPTNTLYNYSNYTDFDQINNNNLNNDLESKLSFSNYKNTIKTVKNEAQKANLINKNFDYKWKTMENFFQNKFYRPETSKIPLNNNNNINEDQSWRSNKTRNITSAKSKNIEFEEINYLKEIRNLSKGSKLISNPKYNIYTKPKGNFGKKVKKENYKIKVSEKNKGEMVDTNLIMKNRRRKENEKEDEICEKIRNNLNEEEEGENIEFNYQVNGERININSKIDPYKEFLEFKNIIVQREEEIKRKELEELNKRFKSKKYKTENLEKKARAFTNKYGLSKIIENKNENDNKDINVILKEEL
jgi:hypothetical protein